MFGAWSLATSCVRRQRWGRNGHGLNRFSVISSANLKDGSFLILALAAVTTISMPTTDRTVEISFAAITAAGVGLDEVRWVANCHLHFDHSGGNPALGNRPIYVQEGELEIARARDDYTLPELVDEGINYEVVSGETELFPGVFLIPTPGHVDGHQSLVLRCNDGTVICAGQAHDSASLFAYDVLARKAVQEGLEEPLPLYPGWMKRFEQFDPARVVFAHDMAVLEFPFHSS